MLSSHGRTASSERVSSKKSKSAAKDGSVSDNHGSYENPTIIDITEPKSIVDKEIDELHAKLPPINKAALRSWQRSQLHDTVVCTCKLIEVTDTDANTLHDSNSKDPSIAESLNVPKMLTDCNVLPQAMPIDDRPSSHGLSDDQSTPFDVNAAATKSIPHTDFNSTVATSTGVSIKATTAPSEPMALAPVKKPAVKSIFDLDYEEDDDPITFKLNHNNNINLNTTKLNKLSSDRDSNNDISDEKSCDELFLNENNKREDGRERGELGKNQVENDTSTHNRSASMQSMAKTNFQADNSDQSSQLNDPTTTNTATIAANVIPSKSTHDEATTATADLNAIAPPQPRFRIEEDVNCKAKQLYITSKQLITEFHIEKLHTSYIPNVNGNWDDAKDEESSVKLEPTDGKSSQMICDNDNDQQAQSNSETIVDSIAVTAATATTTATTTTMNVGETENELNSTETKLDEEDMELFEIEPRITEASIGLYERVVPLCNHLIMDRLPKNLSHINLDFGPSDEVEPHIFLASITVKKEVNTDEAPPLPAQPECRTNATDRIDRSNDNDCDLNADDSFGARIHRDFSIYGCNNDIDDIASERYGCNVIS